MYHDVSRYIDTTRYTDTHVSPPLSRHVDLREIGGRPRSSHQVGQAEGVLSGKQAHRDQGRRDTSTGVFDFV